MNGLEHTMRQLFFAFVTSGALIIFMAAGHVRLSIRSGALVLATGVCGYVMVALAERERKRSRQADAAAERARERVKG